MFKQKSPWTRLEGFFKPFSVAIKILKWYTIIYLFIGPRKTKDKVELEQVPKDFQDSLSKSFGLNPEQQSFNHQNGILNIDIDGQFHSIQNGSILMSSIASSSNTSNPTVMLTAGLMAKKAVEIGLSIPKFVKRSLCPGSGVVTSYLQVCFYFHCDNIP